MDIGPGARFVYAAMLIAIFVTFGLGVMVGIAVNHQFFCR